MLIKPCKDDVEVPGAQTLRPASTRSGRRPSHPGGSKFQTRPISERGDGGVASPVWPLPGNIVFISRAMPPPTDISA